MNVKGPRPGSSPVKLARYLSKYISKDLDSLPRDFAEHRYFSSLSIEVRAERYQIVLDPRAQDVEVNMYRRMLADTLRRIGDYCTVKEWLGGSGTYGWISGFEDPSCRWAAYPLKAMAGSGER